MSRGIYRPLLGGGDNPSQDSYTEKGYHLLSIPKGELGEPSKIHEETMEFLDACNQQSKIMALVELSDLYGAIELYLKKHHPSITMDDLKIMNQITKRVFENGHRTN